MTTLNATLSQGARLALGPQTAENGVAASLLHRLIPEGYEDSSGFHYGKLPPLVVPDTEKCDSGILLSESFTKSGKAIAPGPRLTPQPC